MRQYRSLEEKNRYFRENIIIDDINTCVSELTRYNTSHFFFRGVSNASYMIYSSLQRKFVDRVALIPSLSMPEFSREIMSKFRNSAVLTRAFRKEVQSYKSEIAAWAFIQHYGGPSNLIDFTPKLETALFFATGEGKKYLSCDNSHSLSNYISIYILPDNKYATGNVNEIFVSGGESACNLLNDWYSKNPNIPIDTTNVDNEMCTQPLDIAMWGSSVYGEKSFEITIPGNERKISQNYSNSHIAKQNGNFFVANINEIEPLEEAPFIHGNCNNITDK